MAGVGAYIFNRYYLCSFFVELEKIAMLVANKKRMVIHKLLTRKHGIGVSSESLDYITKALDNTEDKEVQDVISRFASLFQANEHVEQGQKADIILNIEQTKAIFSKIGSSLFLEAALNVGENSEVKIPYVSSILGDENCSKGIDLSSYFVVHDIYKKLERSKVGKFPVYPDIECKREYYKKHYDLLYERVNSNEQIRIMSSIFNKPSKLSYIGSLKGSSNKSCLLLGMLVQLEENKIFLDDSTNSVELSFEKEVCKYSSFLILLTI